MSERFGDEWLRQLKRDLREVRMPCGCRKFHGAHEPGCEVVVERIRRLEAGYKDWADYR